MEIRDILPTIFATLTGPRYQVVRGRDFEWSDKSWTHNAFRIYEIIFGRKLGIKAEMSSFVDFDGNSGQAAHSWEAALSLVETAIRSMFRYRLPVRIWIPILQTPQGIPIFASPYLFAIAFDAASATNRTSGSAGPVTCTHTCTGSNLILISCIDDVVGSGETITAWIYNSVSLTTNGSTLYAQSTTAPYNEQTFVGFLFAPSTGANTLSTTKSGSSGNFMALNASYSGAAQSSFPDAHSSVFNTVSVNRTQSVTIVAANCWALFFACSVIADPTAGTNSTLRINSGGFGISLFDSNGPQSAGSFSMTANASSGRWTGNMVSFAPFVASGPTNVKTWDGITQSTGIKTYEGLALASTKSVIGVT